MSVIQSDQKLQKKMDDHFCAEVSTLLCQIRPFDLKWVYFYSNFNFSTKKVSTHFVDISKFQAIWMKTDDEMKTGWLMFWLFFI